MLPDVLAKPNILISVFWVAAVAALFLSALLFRVPRILQRRHMSLTLLLWGVSKATIIVTYWIIQSAAATKQGWALLVLDLGDLAMLAAAVAYCQGSQFRWSQTKAPAAQSRSHSTTNARKAKVAKRRVGSFGPLCGVLVLLAIWDLTGSAYLPLEYRVLVIAPSAVVATVAVISVGWSFVARWGVWAVPFLLLSVAYAVLQLPAYFESFVIGPVRTQVGMAFAGLDQVFIGLAIGKALLGVCFFALFLSSNNTALQMNRAKYFPNRNVRPPKTLVRTVSWALGFVQAGGILATILSALLKPVRESLARLLGMPI